MRVWHVWHFSIPFFLLLRCLFVCVCVFVTPARLHVRSNCAAREDAADDPVSGPDVLPLAMLWCHTLHPDEWEEAHMGLPCVWQEGPLWTPHHRRVSYQSQKSVVDDTKRSVYHLIWSSLTLVFNSLSHLEGILFLVDLPLLFKVALGVLFGWFGAWHVHVFAGFLWRSSTAAQTVMRSSSKKTAAGPQWNPRRKCKKSPLLLTTTGWTVRHVMIGEGRLRDKMESNKIRIKEMR